MDKKILFQFLQKKITVNSDLTFCMLLRNQIVHPQKSHPDPLTLSIACPSVIMAVPCSAINSWSDRIKQGPIKINSFNYI